MQEHVQLNEYQLAAVRDESRVCLVNANVGSGKTTVLIEKILWLQKEKQIRPEEMIVLTFTNKAANEIKERLSQDTEELYFGTFHSVAMKLLQKELPVEELQYTREFQVCLPEEEIELARRLITETGLKIKYPNRLKKRMEDWESAKGKSYGDDFELLMKRLSQEKVCQNKMSYSDLIRNAVHLLRSHPEYQRPAWLIVDEVQDCDPLQLEFLDAMKGEDTSFFAVGDPNQVIYGWRGSAFGVFYQLKTRYGATEYSLPVNYRSSGTILKAAGRFLQNGNHLEGTLEAGDKIRILGHHDPFQEASYLADRIHRLQEDGVPYHEIAVFYRLQKQGELLRNVLEREGIPVETTERGSLMEIPILCWIRNLCRYLCNEADRPALIQCVTDQKYGDGITEKRLMKLLDQEEGQKIPLLMQIMTLFGKQTFQGPLTQNWILDVKNTIRLAERIGLSSAELQKDLGYTDRFFERLLQYAKGREEAPALEMLKAFLNEAALYGMNFQEEEKTEKEDKVNLMTLHASKGLEFSHVFLIGVNKGLIPLGGSGSDEEEEMRLLFVGMTRAEKYLELSYYSGNTDPGVFPGPSGYLRMINSDLVEVPLKERMDSVEAAHHLQKLKRMVQKEKENLAEKPTEDPTETESSGDSVEEKNRKTRIRHEKYGEGYIVQEDEMMIRICFDDYGEKEMLKAFTNFTLLSE